MKSKNKKTLSKKENKIKTDEAASLYVYATAYFIPRLRKLKEISMSYPSHETEESWNEKLDFIANSFEARISDSFYDLDIHAQMKVKEEADNAAKMLGEVWFDLWS